MTELKWTNDLHFTEFLCNAIICSLCEVFLIRRCYRVRRIFPTI